MKFAEGYQNLPITRLSLRDHPDANCWSPSEDIGSGSYSSACIAVLRELGLGSIPRWGHLTRIHLQQRIADPCWLGLLVTVAESVPELITDEIEIGQL